MARTFVLISILVVAAQGMTINQPAAIECKECTPGHGDQRPIPFSRENGFCPNIPAVFPIELQHILGSWYMINYRERMNYNKPTDCAQVQLSNHTLENEQINLISVNGSSKAYYAPEVWYNHVINSAIAGFTGARSGRWELSGGGLFTGNAACGLQSGACGSLVIVGVTRPLTTEIHDYDTILFMTCQMQTQGAYYEPIPFLNEMGILSRTRTVPSYAITYYESIIEKMRVEFEYLEPISTWNQVGHDSLVCNYN